MSNVDHLIPLREAMALVGLRTTKAYREIKEGRLTVVRNGRRTFVRASEIKRYISDLPTSEESRSVIGDLHSRADSASHGGKP